MSQNEGNILFLVCTPCEKAGAKDFGVKLAGRTQRSWYEHMVPGKQLDAWFHKHSKCGGRCNPDHFVLAHSFTRNHDQDSLKAAVKLAMVQ